MPKARVILLFVRLSYASPSEYSWVDESGRSRTVHQGEGGEQGDPLMPLLFSVGGVALSLHPGEQLCACLHYMYLVCQPDRVVTLFQILSESLFTVTGAVHVGEDRRADRGRTTVVGCHPRGARFAMCLAKSWCEVPILEQITHSGHCHRVCHSCTAKPTTQASGTQWSPSCTVCRFLC